MTRLWTCASASLLAVSLQGCGGLSELAGQVACDLDLVAAFADVTSKGKGRKLQTKCGKKELSDSTVNWDCGCDTEIPAAIAEVDEVAQPESCKDNEGSHTEKVTSVREALGENQEIWCCAKAFVATFATIKTDIETANTSTCATDGCKCDGYASAVTAMNSFTYPETSICPELTGKVFVEEYFNLEKESATTEKNTHCDVKCTSDVDALFDPFITNGLAGPADKNLLDATNDWITGCSVDGAAAMQKTDAQAVTSAPASCGHVDSNPTTFDDTKADAISKLTTEQEEFCCAAAFRQNANVAAVIALYDLAFAQCELTAPNAACCTELEKRTADPAGVEDLENAATQVSGALTLSDLSACTQSSLTWVQTALSDISTYAADKYTAHECAAVMYT